MCYNLIAFSGQKPFRLCISPESAAPAGFIFQKMIATQRFFGHTICPQGHCKLFPSRVSNADVVGCWNKTVSVSHTFHIKIPFVTNSSKKWSLKFSSCLLKLALSSSHSLLPSAALLHQLMVVSLVCKYLSFLVILTNNVHSSSLPHRGEKFFENVAISVWTWTILCLPPLQHTSGSVAINLK